MTHADFALDPFQERAIEAIDGGESVLVAAPTGSGKTVVAEHAVERALAEGGKAFYTTPIKALSNQKFHDLVARHGAAQVGLLTGDNSVQPDAPVVVMTTEVLRNMIYARSHLLGGLRYVVLDEVHYLQDAYRGPAWEEVIIHLPASVDLVCLSATVSNADELTDWLRTVRGPTTSVVEHERPVELVNLFLVEDRTAGRLQLLPTLVDGRPNREGERFDRNPASRAGGRGRPRRRYSTPSRVDVVELLAERDLLPAIAFIFSRAGCDEAVTSCVGAGVRLTDAQERARIDEIVAEHIGGLSDDDLDALGYSSWLAALHAGVAAHHAGMVPPFKEAVEACFVEGLTRVVFATETLALGINMPARTVIIEKLTKFTGERHEFLTPGQYTQLTGRAGRRGIDPIGHAVVLWSPFVSFGEVAGLAASRSFPLASAFRPTYNMAANLVRRYEPAEAHHLLNLSFAQYQADRGVVRMEQRLARRRQELSRLADEARCDLGDVEEYASLVDAAKSSARHARDRDRRAVAETLGKLVPGDVFHLPGGKSAGRVAVLSVSQRRGGGVRARVITAGRRVVLLGESDLGAPPKVLGRIELPEPFAPRSSSFQRDVVQALASFRPRGAPAAARGDGDVSRGDPEQAVLEHPVASCPEAPAHLRAYRRYVRAEREAEEAARQVRASSDSLARRFDQVLSLLELWGYLDGWQLTARGERLVQIFHECDLLVAEALEEGLFDGLDTVEVAALASTFVYEHRSPGPAPEPWFPPGPLRSRWQRLDRLAGDLNADEARLGLVLTRRPDAGFIGAAHAWAAGGDLNEVLEDEELTPGDFVRVAKVLLDLLGQISRAAQDPSTAAAADGAAEAVFRGVVSASSAVQVDEEPVGG